MKRLFFNLIIPVIAFFSMAQTAFAQPIVAPAVRTLSNGGARILSAQGNSAANPAFGFTGHATFPTNLNDGGGGNGIFRPAANTMAFSTSSAERMRISSTGNIGIGTNAPAYRLHVHATASAANTIANFSDSQGRHIFFVPKLGGASYTFASKIDDAGIFWSDNSGWNNTAGFVIAPQRGDWAGIRLDADGSSSLPGYRTTIGTSNSAVSLGIAAGASFGYGTSYIGLNAARNKAGTDFTFETDGANNGGNVIWGDVGGRIRFATEPSTGALSKTRSDAQILAQTKMSIGADGKVTIGDDTNNGTIDINLGQIASGEGIGSKRTSGGNQWGLDFYTAGSNRMRIDNNGKVAIGPLGMTTPGIYGLYVKDGILAEKVKIAIHGTVNWADYVFATDYKLKPLSEVEAFVKANKHLPNVPSAQDLEKDGLDVADMLARQMEKIEELTLYLIEIKKENDELKKAIQTIQDQQK
ncbi:MAG: hypothetical protein ACKVT2_04970 [Saprospiraceae bacterium]